MTAEKQVRQYGSKLLMLALPCKSYFTAKRLEEADKNNLSLIQTLPIEIPKHGR